MVSHPIAFDRTAGSWSMYHVCLKAYFEEKEVTDPAKHCALLVSLLSDNFIHKLQGHHRATMVNSLSFDDSVKYLEEHNKLQANETLASYSFFVRKQGEGDSIQDYIANLRRLAESCNFGSTLDHSYGIT